ncbi:MAG: DNA adenine methylase [Planctomycetaceae bacterium]|nr:DNA adenine methylase [Planctomycetaceae bacterium]
MNYRKRRGTSTSPLTPGPSPEGAGSFVGTSYDRTRHAAVRTDDYVFHQLIPYIGNKRRLLDLIGRAIAAAGLRPGATFFDLFAGSGVVSRFAKRRGFRVLSNDWEPYAEAINRCYVACDAAPTIRGQGYVRTIDELNALAPVDGWVTKHLCPTDDDRIDGSRDRLFYMRKNGMRIDAIRGRIAAWERAGDLTVEQRDCLLAPLLYQACYVSNTSGVFKGFHNGWGGQTGTALYRIASELTLRPAVFHRAAPAHVFRCDATELAQGLSDETIDFTYLDPPYNQHPYGSNYHVLNTITLWDAPPLPPKITGRGDKAAIRTDWRILRRSAYNKSSEAAAEYETLLRSLRSRWIATSYSTDGTIALADLVAANVRRGNVTVLTKGYKRYRVSSQRFSAKPMNVEFILLTDANAKPDVTVDEIVNRILCEERRVIASHPET